CGLGCTSRFNCIFFWGWSVLFTKSFFCMVGLNNPGQVGITFRNKFCWCGFSGGLITNLWPKVQRKKNLKNEFSDLLRQGTNAFPFS
ncbi:hypothetical protein ACVGXO_08650, partial [Enterobacter hormaechei]